MTDFKELREALEAGPTEGPWTHAWGGGHVLIFQSGGGPTFASVPFDGMRDAEHAGANARFIAAANPATISSLLAELDEARRDAARYKWLKDSEMVFHWNTDYCRPFSTVRAAGSRNVMGHYESTEAAIDAAMKDTKT